MTKDIRILWADDEVDFLKSHITYLESKGYKVKSVSNGADAIEIIQSEIFDIVFLDETMPGLSGLKTLQEIKKIRPNIPIVLVTKNEEEDLMEEAIGSQIADYLIKPVKPQQIILTIKKFTENQKLITQTTSRAYQQEFQRIFGQIQSVNDHKDWIELYQNLIYWELELDVSKSNEMQELFEMQKKEANTEFSKFVIKHYKSWINQSDNAPVLSHQIFSKYVYPLLKDDKPTYFILIDNLRQDQWKSIQPYFDALYDLKFEDMYFSILPTATQYSRNAIFAGLTPLQIQQKYPKYWLYDDDDGGKNMYEKELLELQLKNNLKDSIKFSYTKVIKSEHGEDLIQNIGNLRDNKLNAIVFNFVDMLSHARTEMELMKELARDDKAFRALTHTWFENSHLNQLIEHLAQKQVNIVVTTDHGTTQVSRPSKCIGDRQTSTNIRYKAGKNLQYVAKDVFLMSNPKEYQLPQPNISTQYIFAKEDTYLVYQNNYNQFVNFFKDTFQHGGISLEEMIIPLAVYTTK